MPSFKSPNDLAVLILTVRTSLYITIWASHNRAELVAEVALMARIDDFPKLFVDVHVRIMEVVAIRRVVILVNVINVVPSNRRFGHVLIGASQDQSRRTSLLVQPHIHKKIVAARSCLLHFARHTWAASF